MKYRLSPKPGLIKVNRSVSVDFTPLAPRPAGLVTARSPAPAHPLKHKRAALSSPGAAPPDRKKSKVPQSDTKNNAISIKKRRTKHTIDVRKRNPSVLKRNHKDILSKFVDKTKELRDSGIGKSLAIIACGPSILQVDLGKLNNVPNLDIMSINKPDMRIWPTKYWCFCDYSQYRRNADLWEQYNGIIINPSSMKARHQNQILIKNISGKGFSKDLLKGYYIGRSTTFASMQVALWMNYDKIYIFGCDMGEVNGALHFYGQNPDVSNENRQKRFAIEAEYYNNAAKSLDEYERDKFVFCSSYNKWSFVDKFNKLDHKEAVDHILNNVNKDREE